MGTLLTRTYRFGASPIVRVVQSGKLSAGLERMAIQHRVFNSVIHNDGNGDIVMNLDGSVDGVTWTNRGTVTIKGRASGTLKGANRGTETMWRLTARCTNGESDGRIEVFDESGFFFR